MKISLPIQSIARANQIAFARSGSMTSEWPHPSNFIRVRTCCPPTETPSHLYHFLNLPNAWRMETIGYSLVLVQSALKRVKPPKFA